MYSDQRHIGTMIQFINIINFKINRIAWFIFDITFYSQIGGKCNILSSPRNCIRLVRSHTRREHLHTMCLRKRAACGELGHEVYLTYSSRNFYLCKLLVQDSDDIHLLILFTLLNFYANRSPCIPYFKINVSFPPSEGRSYH